MNNQLKGGRRIDDWRPEDETFWQNGGSRVATRNLLSQFLHYCLHFRSGLSGAWL